MKKKTVLSKLKHNKYIFINLQTLKNALWYNIGKEAYIQRINKLDNTWVSEKSSKYFILIKLLKIWKLDKIVISNNDGIFYDNSNINTDDNILIMKYNNKIPLLFYITDMIRNAVAHGEFNNIKNECYLVNQYKPKEDSQISFLLHSNRMTIAKIVEKLNEFVRLLSDNECENKYNCVSDVLNAYYNKKYLKCKDKTIVYIFNHLIGKSDTFYKDIIRLVEKYDIAGKIIFIYKTASERNKEIDIYSKNKKCIITLLPEHRMIEHFGLKNVICVE